jgi:uncharacterized membrane protein
MNALALIGLFLAGMLSGIEVVVRYGVHPALVALPDRVHLLARHEIVRVVRVLVPAVLLPSVIVGIAVLAVSGAGGGLPFRWAGVASYAVYVLIVFLGTVPINDRFFAWDPDAPPADWKAVIRRWALIDVVRSSTAVLAFACFLVAAGLG